MKTLTKTLTLTILSLGFSFSAFADCGEDLGALAKPQIEMELGLKNVYLLFAPVAAGDSVQNIAITVRENVFKHPENPSEGPEGIATYTPCFRKDVV